MQRHIVNLDDDVYQHIVFNGKEHSINAGLRRLFGFPALQKGSKFKNPLFEEAFEALAALEPGQSMKFPRPLKPDTSIDYKKTANVNRLFGRRIKEWGWKIQRVDQHSYFTVTRIS